MGALLGSIAGPWYRQIAQHFCALRRRQDVHPPPQLDWFLPERRQFKREHDNIGDTPTADEQQVSRNGDFGILMRLADCSLYINIKIPSVNITLT